MDTGIEEVPEPVFSRAIWELRDDTESFERDRAERESADRERREDRALLPDDMAVQLDVFA